MFCSFFSSSGALFCRVARQGHFKKSRTPKIPPYLFSSTYKLFHSLFCTFLHPQNGKAPVFNRLRTLWPKTPGVGVAKPPRAEVDGESSFGGKKVPFMNYLRYFLEVAPCPLESTLTKNRSLTPAQSTLTKTLDLKSFRINTYKKTGGWGADKVRTPPEAKSAVCRPRQEALRSNRRASPVREVAKSPVCRPRRFAARSPVCRPRLFAAKSPRQVARQTNLALARQTSRNARKTGAAAAHLRESGHAHGK